MPSAQIPRSNSLVVFCLLLSFATPSRIYGDQQKASDEQPPRVGPPVTGAPFSAELVIEEKPLRTDGSFGVSMYRRVLVYRNSAGKTRIEKLIPADKGLSEKTASVEITDPTTRMSNILDPRSHVDHRITREGMTIIITGCCPEKMVALASTEAFVLTAAGKSLPVPGPGWRGDGLGAEPINRIEGFTVEGYGNKLTLPEGAQGNKQAIIVALRVWYAPEVKLPLLMKLSDSRRGDTTMRFINIQKREPEPSLFVVPPNYQTVTEKNTFTMN